MSWNLSQGTDVYVSSKDKTYDVLEFRKHLQSVIKSPPTIKEECKRSMAMDQLRRKFRDIFHKYDAYIPQFCFIRWIFEMKYLERNEMNTYPLIPLCKHPSEVLRRELTEIYKKKNVRDYDRRINNIEEELKIVTKQCRESLKFPIQGEGFTILESNPPIYTAYSIRHSLNNKHTDKLRDLYKVNSSDNSFNHTLFVLLTRYDSLTRELHTSKREASSYHAALPKDVFQFLTDEMGVTMECFASPLNCYYPNYCSAFADTDVWFGSCGSFFDFHPINGSFEVNPPFTEEVMLAMVDHIERLLNDSNEPLSFAVIIPEWIDPPTPALVQMQKSMYRTEDFVVNPHKHSYIEGSQHKFDVVRDQSGKNVFGAIHASHVFFLQNKQGMKKWTPTMDKINKMRQVWTGNN